VVGRGLVTPGRGGVGGRTDPDDAVAVDRDQAVVEDSGGQDDAAVDCLHAPRMAH
jgi:hypothetical protein